MLQRIGTNEKGIINIYNNKYEIKQLNNTFILIFNDTWIYFTPETKKGGLYFKINFIIRNNKTYKAQKFLYKYITLVREASYLLLKNNFLWDYIESDSSLDVRKKYFKNINDTPTENEKILIVNNFKKI